jgi:nucleotide-binding universal stress UspA family protein
MAPFNKMLIATDGSEGAEAAVKKGLEIAKFMNIDVIAMSVIDDSSLANVSIASRTAIIQTHIEKPANDAVKQVQILGEKVGVHVDTLVREGSPANEIIKESAKHDLIVMGTLGISGFSHFLLGSVAEKVVRFASCPVLVIKTPKNH